MYNYIFATCQLTRFARISKAELKTLERQYGRLIRMEVWK